MQSDHGVWSGVQLYLEQKQACNCQFADATGLAVMHACC